MKNAKKNKDRVFIGDMISTNNKFKPLNEKGDKITTIGAFRGMVVTKRKKDGKYGIRFGKLSWANQLDGLLSHKCGYFLSKDEFEIENDY